MSNKTHALILIYKIDNKFIFFYIYDKKFKFYPPLWLEQKINSDIHDFVL